MLVLDTTTKSLEVILTASSTAPLNISTSYREITATGYSAGSTLANTNGTTQVTALAAPASGAQRVVDDLVIFNPNAASAEVIVRYNLASNYFVLHRVILNQYERLQYSDNDGWTVYTAAGAPKIAMSQGITATSGSQGTTVLGADVINNNATANTMQDVTGLSFPVVANNRYRFLFVINYQSAATTTGSRFSINGPAFSLLSYASEWSLTTTSLTFNTGLGAYDLPAASNASSASTAANQAVIRGHITPTVDGTVIARFASEVLSSAITVKAGSYVEFQQV